jgi:phosphoribosylamine--glycine ligase
MLEGASCAWYRRAGMSERSGASRVVVIGAGAREHALASALRGAGCEVVVAPGNAGTRGVARNEAVRVDDLGALVALCVKERAELVVVGPELPLTLGVVDALEAAGVRAFGPGKGAAQLEGSKAFMKRFCARHAIPTAACEVFTDADAADAYVAGAQRPLVVKADGLAAGKGVVVAKDAADATDAIDRFMRRRELGDAGATVVIEEVLAGEEASFHVVCDGERYVPLAAAQDHKRVGDGDRGPNTGGMGAYAPAPIMTPEVRAQALRAIVEPTLHGMKSEGNPFRGVLFVGLMIEAGVPRVLEFNVRFGDPETSVLVPLLEPAQWLLLLDGAARGDLREAAASLAKSTAPKHALCVVMASKGYPAKPRTGDAITGLEAPLPPGAYVFHAGTAARADGAIVTAGGRVLTVGGCGASLSEAAALAYRAVSGIHWDGEHHRSDIGHRALAR